MTLGEFMSSVLVARGERVLSLLPDTICLRGNNCLGWGTLVCPFETLDDASEKDGCDSYVYKVFILIRRV